MKKLMMIVALLGGALAYASVAQSAQSNVAPEIAWCNDSMADVAEDLRSNLIADTVNGTDLKDMIESYFEQNRLPIDDMPAVFAGRVSDALKDSNTQRGEKNYNELENYLTTKGKFIAKMYNMAPQKYSWITTEIALRGTTFGSEYRKEYFLVDATGKKMDAERQDGKQYFFYSEPTRKPGLSRILGIGYVDKRSWKKYLFEKAKYPTLLGVLGYGAYKGAQTDRGQQWIASAKESEPYKYLAGTQAGQWVEKNVPSAFEATKRHVSDWTKKGKEYASDWKQYAADTYAAARTSVTNYLTKRDVRKLENIEKKQDEIRKKLYDLGSEVGKGIWTNKEVVALQQQFRKLEYDKKALYDKNIQLQEMKGYDDEIQHMSDRDQERQREQILARDNALMSRGIDQEITGMRERDQERQQYQQEQAQLREQERQMKEQRKLLRQELRLYRGNEQMAKEIDSNLKRMNKNDMLRQQYEQERQREQILARDNALMSREIDQEITEMMSDPEITEAQNSIEQEKIDMQEQKTDTQAEQDRLAQEEKRIKAEQKLLRKKDKVRRDNQRLTEEIDNDLERIEKNDRMRQEYQEQQNRLREERAQREENMRNKRLRRQQRRQEEKQIVKELTERQERERQEYLDTVQNRRNMRTERLRRPNLGDV